MSAVKKVLLHALIMLLVSMKLEVSHAPVMMASWEMDSTVLVRIIFILEQSRKAYSYALKTGNYFVTSK